MVLSTNVTLADILHTLSAPEEYVRRALANMHMAQKDHGPLVLRIGRMGTGQFPHYRFDQREANPILGFTSQVPVQAFNGRNHKALVTEGEEPDILRDEHWSGAGMTYDELAQLLGSIRAKPRR